MHSSILAWRILWTEEPDRTEATYYACMHWRRKWQPTPVFLPGECQVWGSLLGCRLWGRTESDTTEGTQQQQQFYNIVLVCAIHQHESAIGIHTSPPSGTSLPPPIPYHPSRLSQRIGFNSLHHTANSHWLCILQMVDCKPLADRKHPKTSASPLQPERCLAWGGNTTKDCQEQNF